MIKTLFKYFKPHRKIFLLDMFCAIVVASVDLAFPLVFRAAIMNSCRSRNTEFSFL